LRPLAVADIPPRGLHVKVEASAEERRRIAAEFELAALDALAGSFHVRPTSAGARVEGKVEARLRQICVVSLEPFEVELSEPVDLRFASERSETPPRGGEITVSLEEEDPPDPIIDGRIDLGAVTLEFLALGVDPYPRKPGVEPPGDMAPDERPPSPFAALAGLAAKRDGKK
jgi:hypothetical protein